MFPTQSISTSTEIFGNKTYTLLATTSPYRVLGTRMQQSGVASETILSCGSTVIAHNYAKDYNFDTFNFRCYDNLVVEKTGQDNSFVTVTYLPSYVEELQYVQPLPAPSVINGFTHGEIIIGFFLLFICLATFFGGIINHVAGMKIRKKHDA